MKWIKCCLSLILIAFVVPWRPVQAADRQTLTVFAAASLVDAFEEIATTFETEHAGTDVIFNFGGSSALAAQLIEGAPADVFASANTQQMEVARAAGRIAEPAFPFAYNRLVVILPADNPGDVQSLRDLANPGLLLVIAAPGVPVRDYTDTMLEKLTAAPGYGEDYSQGVLANVVSEENNVRQVAAKIALGEADAGIVYVSDVTPDLAADVRMIAISDPYNTIATYPIAVASDTAQPELARAFADFVVSEAGQDALARWGFIPARHSEPFAHQLEVIVEGLHSLWKAGW